jgi:hypothetical protein
VCSGQLQKKINESVAEQRGWQWARINFAVESWSETDRGWHIK